MKQKFDTRIKELDKKPDSIQREKMKKKFDDHIKELKDKKGT